MKQTIVSFKEKVWSFTLLKRKKYFPFVLFRLVFLFFLSCLIYQYLFFVEDINFLFENIVFRKLRTNLNVTLKKKDNFKIAL